MTLLGDFHGGGSLAAVIGGVVWNLADTPKERVARISIEDYEEARTPLRR